MKLIYNINPEKYLLTYATTKLLEKISSGYNCNANDIRFQNTSYWLVFLPNLELLLDFEEWLVKHKRVLKIALKHSV